MNQLGARAFGNATCPAVRQTHALSDKLEHATCYGPYASGELGANITHILGSCCNATGNVSAPVEVVSDNSADGLPSTDCWYSCNATWLETQGQPDYGDAFWRLERCVRSYALSADNGTDGLLVRCYPKRSGGGGVLRPRGPSRMALCFIVWLGVVIFSA